MEHARTPKRGQLFLMRGPSLVRNGSAVRYIARAGLSVLATKSRELKDFLEREQREGLSPEGDIALVELLPRGAGRDAKGEPMLINEELELGRPMASDDQPQVVD